MMNIDDARYDDMKEKDDRYYEELSKDIEESLRENNSSKGLLGFERADREMQERASEEKEMFSKGGGFLFKGDKDFERDALNELKK